MRIDVSTRPWQAQPGPRSPNRLGLSLLEVMFSLSLLAVVLSTMVGGMAHLNSAQGFAAEQEEANNIMRSLLERIQTAPATDLAVTNSWSAASFLTNTVGDPNTGIDTDVFLQAGILARPTALENAEVFIEYYRGTNATLDGSHVSGFAGQLGLLQWDDESDAAYANRINDTFLDNGAVSDLYRIANQTELLALQDAPLAVRLIVRWGAAVDPAARLRVICMTGRIADPTSITVN